MKPIHTFAFILLCFSCTRESTTTHEEFYLSDPNLVLTLIAEQPTIQTPIGMAFDHHDNLYVLESHTHSPASGYKGPSFDLIKYGADDNEDGLPDRWHIFADSIEDGMNIIAVEGQGILLATKNQIIQFQDVDSDGISDQKTILLDMQRPNYVYDHAGILGLAAGPDGWLYVSRGNTGGQFWEIMGTDRTTLRGYGDGGNIIRCKMNGSSLEEVATGFWNPFDIKFTQEGRLLATDNDPDSRGPNRLLDIVSGGDYGYQSLYGGSGIHPYLAWNGELPGTLPYAAPLGEAPCALIDARYTNFGSGYSNHILVNIWEENNIVKVPLKSKGTTVTGQPTVWLQGDSLFHPVALATNSKGDLYISDWVIRQYPNHGHGRIWRISTTQPGRPNAIMPETKYLKRLHLSQTVYHN